MHSQNRPKLVNQFDFFYEIKSIFISNTLSIVLQAELSGVARSLRSSRIFSQVGSVDLLQCVVKIQIPGHLINYYARSHVWVFLKVVHISVPRHREHIANC
jgi:hypothetical protein